MNRTALITPIDPAPSDFLRFLLVFVFLFIILVGLIGNLLVLLSVLTNHIKIRRSSTNLLLVNMSCADLIILLFNLCDILQIAFDRSWPTGWHLGLRMCKFVRFSQVLGCYVSVETLLVISIERYVAIVHPMRMSPNRRRRQRLIWIFLVIWSIGMLMASPNLYLLTLHPHNNRANLYLCGLSDHDSHAFWILTYKYLELILFYVIPMFVQTILYIIICRNIFLVDQAVQAHCRADQLQQYSISESHRPYSATKSSSLVPTAPMTDPNPSLIPMVTQGTRSGGNNPSISLPNATMKTGDRARKKAIIMLLLVAFLYFFAFSPAQINFIYSQVNRLHHLYENRLFFALSILLVLSSTAINPILFYIFSKFFRHKFNIILRSVCPVCRLGSHRSNRFPMV